MNSRTFIKELKEYGPGLVMKHTVSKIKGTEDAEHDYIISLHNLSTEKEKEEELAHNFREAMGYDMDFKNPSTFCQKIYWMRLHGATDLKTVFADKYLMRDYVEEKLGKGYTVGLLGAWDRFDDIDFDKLPDSFVLKANHGCGYNIIVKDKKSFDKKAAKKQMDKWMKTDYALIHLEMQYYKIPRKIIAEEYIDQMGDEGSLYDYKIHCFGGVPLFCQVIGDRGVGGSKGKQAFYDMDWKPENFSLGNYPPFEKEIEKPAAWEEMKNCAVKLSAPVDYVRVDMYEIDGKVYIGELTCTPAGGNFPKMEPRETDKLLGEKIKLQEMA